MRALESRNAARVPSPLTPEPERSSNREPPPPPPAAATRGQGDTLPLARSVSKMIVLGLATGIIA